MSRFTSPYHINRPSAQQLADRQGFAATTNLNTVSPLYTDDLGFPINASTNSHTFTQSYDLSFSGVSPLAALSETPTRMPGRATTSLLGYNQPGREHSRKRASRWLVLVLPPSFITESQRMFGHTLSSGPSSRLSQGLLVPLYPTVNRFALQLSIYCMSHLFVAFPSELSDVCATGCDRARIQFPEYRGDLFVYAHQRSWCAVYTTDK